MKIDVWVDFHCPYCMIVKQRMNNAFEELKLDADVCLRSFLLNPEQDRPNGLAMAEHVAKEYGGEPAEAAKGFKALDEQAAALGIFMDMERSKYAYMIDAHRLLQYANTQGKGKAFYDLAQRALFGKFLVLSEHAVLLDLAERAGLDVNEARDVLKSERFREDVLYDDARAREMVIDYVPYFVVDGRYRFSGDLTYEEVKGHLSKAKQGEAHEN